MTTHSKNIQIYFLLFSLLLISIFFLTKCLHNRPRLKYILSEPAMALMVGITVSFLATFVLVTADDVEDDDTEARAEVLDMANTILSFHTRVFFQAMLPPILFTSGHQLQRELFYRHFKPIALFSCVGTCACGFACGFLLYFIQRQGWFGDFEPSLMELLVFGALIAATDTVSVVGILKAKRVDPHLFSLIFGESALNDAVAIVLFKSLSELLKIEDLANDASSTFGLVLKYAGVLLFQAVCSPILGIISAFIIGLTLKYGDFRKQPLMELSIYVLQIYVPFILSEVLELSGMITIFFTGICAKRYMEPNVSEDTRQHSETLFELLSFLAETCIFLELGLAVFGISGSFHWRFTLFSLLTALIGRALSIYPLASLFNIYLARGSGRHDNATPSGERTLEHKDSLDSYTSDGSSWTESTPHRKRDKLIPLKFMHMMWFTGLRGAVAYACACEFPDVNGHRDEIVATTMIIVLVTIILMGGGTEALMDYLDIRTNVCEEEYMRHWRQQRSLQGRFHYYERNLIYRFVVREGSEDSQEHKDAMSYKLTPVLSNITSLDEIDEYKAPCLDGVPYENRNGTTNEAIEYDEGKPDFAAVSIKGRPTPFVDVIETSAPTNRSTEGDDESYRGTVSFSTCIRTS